MSQGKNNWRKIIEEQVIPLLWQFRSLDIEPTIRGFFYVLADRQIILKEQSVYKNFDKALVTARKNRVIAANAFVDDTRHVIKDSMTNTTLSTSASSMVSTTLTDFLRNIEKKFLGGLDSQIM